ncbi:unnamed protein product [marine sediment metagenome]|uniref:Phage tail protein n=1 Tax=marine sediment metagenome TaxID=412755 RepID=X0SH91_9ZZZZ
MAQTSDAVALACGLLEVASNCVNYQDIGGSSSTVSGTDQTRMSGESYTFDGDGAIIQGGKREPMELVFEIVYSETALEAFEYVRALFEAVGCGYHMCARWSPGGGNGGDALYTTGEGWLVSFTYPPMDAKTGGPVMAGFTLKVGSITQSVIAT